MTLDKFTIKAQEAVQAALEAAQRSQNQAIEPIHLLNGILLKGQDITQFLFQSMSVNTQQVKMLAESERYYLIEVNLMTGRHHQIRCQLAKLGCPIKGDLKYGAKRSNPDGSISLLARRVEFLHPVSKKQIEIVAPLPEENLWQSFKRL